MKRNRFIATVAALAVIGTTPVTSQAAQLKVVQICPGEDGYPIVRTEDDACIRQIVDQLDDILGSSGNDCPDISKLIAPGCTISEAPKDETPEVSQPSAPEEEAPSVEEPQPVEPPVSEKPQCAENSASEKPQFVDSPSDDCTQPVNRPSTDCTQPVELPSTEKPKPAETPSTGNSQPAEHPVPESPQPTATPAPAKPQPSPSPAPAKPQPSPSPEAPQKEPDKSGQTDASYAEQIVNLVNTERAKEGLSAVELDADLTAAANIRAREIRQQFAHTRPDGRNFSTVLTDNGISYWGCGENIAYGQRSSEEVMNGWMNSSGHRANIMNRSFKHIGVGFYQDERGVKYWVQLFTY